MNEDTAATRTNHTRSVQVTARKCCRPAGCRTGYCTSHLHVFFFATCCCRVQVLHVSKKKNRQQMCKKHSARTIIVMQYIIALFNSIVRCTIVQQHAANNCAKQGCCAKPPSRVDNGYVRKRKGECS